MDEYQKRFKIICIYTSHIVERKINMKNKIKKKYSLLVQSSMPRTTEKKEPSILVQSSMYRSRQKTLKKVLGK